jgi:hypothetical protein
VRSRDERFGARGRHGSRPECTAPPAFGTRDARPFALTGGRPSPLLVDMRDTGPLDRPTRVELTRRSDLQSAVALIVGTPLTRMMANFFLSVNKPIFPTRLFDNEASAVVRLVRWSTGSTEKWASPQGFRRHARGVRKPLEPPAATFQPPAGDGARLSANTRSRNRRCGRKTRRAGRSSQQPSGSWTSTEGTSAARLGVPT